MTVGVNDKLRAQTACQGKTTGWQGPLANFSVWYSAKRWKEMQQNIWKSAVPRSTSNRRFLNPRTRLRLNKTPFISSALKRHELRILRSLLHQQKRGIRTCKQSLENDPTQEINRRRWSGFLPERQHTAGKWLGRVESQGGNCAHHAFFRTVSLGWLRFALTRRNKRNTFSNSAA